MLPLTCQPQIFFFFFFFYLTHARLWSLHKIIMTVDLVRKCWCKSGSDSACRLSIGSLSPPSARSRGAASPWCQEEETRAFIWALVQQPRLMVKTFSWACLCADAEQKASVCQKPEPATCLCVFLTAGWSSQQPLRRNNDALSLDIVWHILKTSPLPFFFSFPLSLS